MLDLKRKVAHCRNLTSALGAIGDSPASGVLRLLSSTLKGSVAFSDGTVTGAYIEGSDKRGEEAFLELFNAEFDNCECEDVDPLLTQPECHCSIDIQTVARRTSGESSTVRDAEDSGMLESMQMDTLTGEVGLSEEFDPNITQEWNAAPLDTYLESQYNTENNLKAVDADALDETIPVEIPPAAAPAAEAKPFQHPDILDSQSEIPAYSPNLLDDSKIFGESQPTLNDQQLRLLQQSSMLQDPEAFYTDDPEFMMDGDASIGLKHEILAQVELDHASFDASPREYTPEEQGVSLDAEKKHLLNIYSEVRDADAFHEELGHIDDDAILKDESEVWMAEQSARPTEELAAEFAVENPQMLVDPNAHFVDFVEPTKEEAPETDENGDPLPKPMVEDYASLIPPPPASFVQQDDLGLVSRQADPNHVAVGYEGPMPRDREKTVTGPMIAMTIVGVMFIGLFTLPAMIRAQARADVNAELEMRNALREEMREEVSYNVQKKQDVGPVAASGGIGTGYHGGSGGSSSAASSNEESEIIADAKTSVSAGKGAAAIETLEKRLIVDPHSAAIRIELIKMLIANKEFARARALAIEAFRDPTYPPKEHNIFWELFKQAK